MGQSLLVTAEETAVPPILIVDKEGSLGLGLCAKLQSQAQVVVVSRREPEDKENTLSLPFSESVPEIPEEQYSHIFFVLDDEKKEAGIVTACIKKAQRDGSYFCLIVDRRKLSRSPHAYLPQSLRNCAVVVVGDVFNIPVHKKHAFVIERLFKEAKISRALALPKMGLEKLYPVAYLDAVSAILQVAFSGKIKSTVSLVYPKFAVTELGIARAMQKVNPSLKIDFSDSQSEKEEEVLQDEGEFVLPDEYPVFELLEKAYSAYSDEQGSNAQPVREEAEVFTTPLVRQPTKKKKSLNHFFYI